VTPPAGAALPPRLDRVRGRRAATTAHDLDTVFGHELRQVLGEGFGRQIVVHLSFDDAGQAGVGRQARGIGAVSLNWRSGSYISTGPVAQLRPIRSTPSGTEGGDRRADLGAGQHASGEFYGDLGLDRDHSTVPNHGPVARGDRGLAREQVVDGLDTSTSTPPSSSAKRAPRSSPRGRRN